MGQEGSLVTHAITLGLMGQEGSFVTHAITPEII